MIRKLSAIVIVVAVFAAMAVVTCDVSVRHLEAQPMGPTPGGGFIPPTKIGGGSGGGGGGDIEGVAAGSGLTGGGTSGSVTVDVGAGSGISVSADAVSVNLTPTSCSGQFVSAISALGVGTCTSEVGDIAGVTTGASSGLSGGCTSGTCAVTMLTTCGSGEVLKWNGSAWACAADDSGGGLSGGATNALTKWTGATSVGTSIASDNGAAITITDGSLIQDRTAGPDTVGPEHWFYGYNGRWVAGLDVANAPTTRDYVLAGRGRTYSFNDGATTNTDATLTSASEGGFHSSMVGASISGAGIPGGTTVASVTSSTSLEMSAAATATATGVRVTVTQSGVDDFVYARHRGRLSPTLGLGITPPDGDYRVQVAGPGSSEAGMGSLQVIASSGQTGHTIAIADSAGTDRTWFDSTGAVQGNHATYDSSLVVKGDASTYRTVAHVNTGGAAYGNYFPSDGNDLRFRYFNGGVDIAQFSTAGTSYWYEAASFAKGVTIGDGAGDAHSITGTLSLQGSAGSDGQVITRVGGVPTWADAAGGGSPVTATDTITGTTNDWSVGSTVTTIFVTGASAPVVTGITGGADGRVLHVFNTSATAIAFSNEGGGSTAANRILAPEAVAWTSLGRLSGLTFVYDGSASRWVIQGHGGTRMPKATISGAVTIGGHTTIGDADTDDLNSRATLGFSGTDPSVSSGSCTVTGEAQSFQLSTSAEVPSSNTCVIAFNRTFNSAPYCVLYPINANAEGLGFYPTTSTTTLTMTAGKTVPNGATWNVFCPDRY